MDVGTSRVFWRLLDFPRVSDMLRAGAGYSSLAKAACNKTSRTLDGVEADVARGPRDAGTSANFLADRAKSFGQEYLKSHNPSAFIADPAEAGNKKDKLSTTHRCQSPTPIQVNTILMLHTPCYNCFDYLPIISKFSQFASVPPPPSHRGKRHTTESPPFIRSQSPSANSSTKASNKLHASNQPITSIRSDQCNYDCRLASITRSPSPSC